MMNRIEIYPSREHLDKAYGVFCAKRFKALLVERSSSGIYEGDSLAMDLFCAELRKAGALFMPLQVAGSKIVTV